MEDHKNVSLKIIVAAVAYGRGSVTRVSNHRGVLGGGCLGKVVMLGGLTVL